jgi:DNA-binding response OmpR family regulator
VREGAAKEGEDIALTDREVDILAYLVRHRQAPVSRDMLLKNVWQYQEGVDTHTLETHIYRLRQKIEASADEPRLLLTVEGGYRLHLPETAV